MLFLKCQYFLTLTNTIFLQQLNRSLPQEEDSLDAEDIFDLEGMDSHNDMGSDQDDYDSDSKCNFDSFLVQSQVSCQAKGYKK